MFPRSPVVEYYIQNVYEYLLKYLSTWPRATELRKSMVRPAVVLMTHSASQTRFEFSASHLRYLLDFCCRLLLSIKTVLSTHAICPLSRSIILETVTYCTTSLPILIASITISLPHTGLSLLSCLPTFFDIPRELRDIIYEHYITIDGGYIFNYKTRKLEPARLYHSQSPFILQLTCSLIAKQVRGLALTHNIITFRTVEDSRLNARRWHEVLYWFDKYETQLDPASLRIVRRRKPWGFPLEPELDHMAHVLTKVGKRMDRVTRIRYDRGHLYRLNKDDREKYFYSAVAAAVLFLERHPRLLKYMRRVVIDEDHPSVGYPELHGRGLIPFCAENPQLRIQRQLQLWTSVLLIGRYRGMHNPITAKWNVYNGGIYTRNTSVSIARWLSGASDLLSAIDVLLDGGLIPDQASELFRDVWVPHVIMQRAFENAYEQGFLGEPEESLESRTWPPFIADGYTNDLMALVKGQSRVSCNFEIRDFDPQDIDDMLWKHRGLSYDGWDNLWSHSTGSSRWMPGPPLPEWAELIGQLIVEDHRA